MFTHNDLYDFNSIPTALFIDKRVKDEFDDPRLQPVLREAFIEFSKWFLRTFYMPITITDILRNDPKSDHDFSKGKAIDIRCKDFSGQTQTMIINWWLEKYPRHEQSLKDGIQFTARSAYAHDSGQGYHIHISID